MARLLVPAIKGRTKICDRSCCLVKPSIQLMWEEDRRGELEVSKEGSVYDVVGSFQKGRIGSKLTSYDNLMVK